MLDETELVQPTSERPANQKWFYQTTKYRSLRADAIRRMSKRSLATLDYRRIMGFAAKRELVWQRLRGKTLQDMVVPGNGYTLVRNMRPR